MKWTSFKYRKPKVANPEDYDYVKVILWDAKQKYVIYGHYYPAGECKEYRDRKLLVDDYWEVGEDYTHWIAFPTEGPNGEVCE